VLAVFAAFDPLHQGMGMAMRGDDQIYGRLFIVIRRAAKLDHQAAGEIRTITIA
jgi:hypothetical protein